MAYWKLHGKLEDGGHRIFEHDGKYAIADNSGTYPDNTDDGILWLDFDRPITIGARGASLPVKKANEKDAKYHTGTGIAGTAEAMRLFPRWQIKIEDKKFAALVQALATRWIADGCK